VYHKFYRDTIFRITIHSPAGNYKTVARCFYAQKRKEAKMPSKTEEYLALAQRTANGLTRYWESWTDYGVSLPSVCCFKTFFDFFSKTSWQGLISMVNFL
jgi:hypothetical protein